MEKIQENILCKQACSYVFVQVNYIKAHVLMYFFHLVLTFTPHYIIMVKGLLSVYKIVVKRVILLYLFSMQSTNAIIDDLQEQVRGQF